MELIEPAYYAAFRCLAAACPDSCCKAWDVEIDRKAAEFYVNLPGSLGRRLRDGMRLAEDGTAVMVQSQGRCPMWRRDGLCEIQAQLGEGALCQVCREFPRIRHDYGTFVELGLELSCPEAARLILTTPPAERVTHIPGGEPGAYDRQAMALLRSSRSLVISLLDDPVATPGEALAVLLVYAGKVQSALDGGEPPVWEPAADLAAAKALAQPGDLAAILRFYRSLEILTPAWRQRLERPIPDAPWSKPLRALARYGVARYWLQAVSDGDLMGRAKFIALSCLVVKALGGDPIGTAQLYSKEIENDPDNMDAILDGAYRAPALADAGLLGLLLEECQKNQKSS